MLKSVNLFAEISILSRFFSFGNTSLISTSSVKSPKKLFASPSFFKPNKEIAMLYKHSTKSWGISLAMFFKILVNSISYKFMQ